jgi:hypothetical protein
MSELKPQKSEEQDTTPAKNPVDQGIQIYDTPTPPTRRLSLTNVRRPLTDEELANPGVQKMLLDILEEAESERDNNKAYIASFYEADKKAAVLGERLLKDKKIDVFFGAGVGLGGAILGLSPFFGQLNVLYGVICGFIGLALITASSIGRAIKK